MIESRPSRTALRVAYRRATHQILDKPKVFDDPLAALIIGPELAAKITSDSTNDHPASKTLRAFLAARSRFAEDKLAYAVERGVRQVVILGAGLDTFAFRNPYAKAGLHVFEVDHPATQSWKQELIRAAKISITSEVTFVPVDFEQETLGHALTEAGFQRDRPAFFSWLGVTPYLTHAAFLETMQFIASMAAESDVVFDYAISRSSLSPSEQVALDILSSRVAAAGEPFQIVFSTKRTCCAASRDGISPLGNP